MSDRIEGRFHAVIREGDEQSNRAWGPWIALSVAIATFVYVFFIALPWGA